MKEKLSELLQHFKELYSKEAELKLRLEAIRKEIEGVEAKILKYGMMDEPLLPLLPSFESVIMQKQRYSPTWGIEKKATYIYNEAGFCLSNRELVNRICELESKVGDNDFSKRSMSTVADALGRRWKAKRAFGRYEDDNVIYYGPIEWFNPNGSVKDQYKKER